MNHSDPNNTSGNSPTKSTVALPKCPITQKKSFLSEGDAIAFEERNRAEYNNPRQYAYACDCCPAWHLSATPPGNSTIARVPYSPTGIGTGDRNNDKRGRKGIQTEDVVNMRQSGMSVREIAEKLGITPISVHYHLNKRKEKPSEQLVTYEQHRHRRIELEAEVTSIKQEIDRLKSIEDRLLKERQLKVVYASDGEVTLEKNGRELKLTAEDVKKLLAGSGRSELTLS